MSDLDRTLIRTICSDNSEYFTDKKYTKCYNINDNQIDDKNNYNDTNIDDLADLLLAHNREKNSTCYNLIDELDTDKDENKKYKIKQIFNMVKCKQPESINKSSKKQKPIECMRACYNEKNAIVNVKPEVLQGENLFCKNKLIGPTFLPGGKICELLSEQSSKKMNN